MANKTSKGYIKINPDLCKACYLCVEACPSKAIKISRILNLKGYYPAHFEPEPADSCTACAQCATTCPDIAIEVYRD